MMHFLCLHGLGTNAQVLENNLGLAPPLVFQLTVLLPSRCCATVLNRVELIPHSDCPLRDGPYPYF